MAKLGTSPQILTSANRTKRRFNVPSHHFVQNVLLFCIVHQVPHYPCNTSAGVSVILWTSAAVLCKTTTQIPFFFLLNPAGKKREVNDFFFLKNEKCQDTIKVCKVPLFFHILEISSDCSVHCTRGVVFSESNISNKQALKKEAKTQ